MSHTRITSHSRHWASRSLQGNDRKHFSGLLAQCGFFATLVKEPGPHRADFGKHWSVAGSFLETGPVGSTAPGTQATPIRHEHPNPVTELTTDSRPSRFLYANAPQAGQ